MGPKVWGGLTALAALVALVLGFTSGLPAVLAYLGGYAIGAASLAAVTIRVHLITSGRAEQQRWLRLLATCLTLPYYLLVALALWALATWYRDQAPWLVIGYLQVLTAFAATLATRRRTQAAPPRAE